MGEKKHKSENSDKIKEKEEKEKVKSLQVNKRPLKRCISTNEKQHTQTLATERANSSKQPSSNRIQESTMLTNRKMYISDKPFRDDSTKLKRSNSEVDTSRRLNINKSDNIKNLPKINEANHRLIRTDRLRHSSYQLSASRNPPISQDSTFSNFTEIGEEQSMSFCSSCDNVAALSAVAADENGRWREYNTDPRLLDGENMRKNRFYTRTFVGSPKDNVPR